MDEADQLGDRIAIMAKGDVKCCGSSLFLKGRYGVGYTLTLTKGEHFQESKVSELITSAIPDTSQLSNIAGEISYRLPFQSSAFFADVFDEFDSKQEEFGIVGYGISVTTLEEVFLRQTNSFSFSSCWNGSHQASLPPFTFFSIGCSFIHFCLCLLCVQALDTKRMRIQPRCN